MARLPCWCISTSKMAAWKSKCFCRVPNKEYESCLKLTGWRLVREMPGSHWWSWLYFDNYRNVQQCSPIPPNCSCNAQFHDYRILSVIRAVLNKVRFEKKRGCATDQMWFPIALNFKLREGPNRGMRYKPEVHISPQEHGNTEPQPQPKSPRMMAIFNSHMDETPSVGWRVILSLAIRLLISVSPPCNIRWLQR